MNVLNGMNEMNEKILPDSYSFATESKSILYVRLFLVRNHTA